MNKYLLFVHWSDLILYLVLSFIGDKNSSSLPFLKRGNKGGVNLWFLQKNIPPYYGGIND